MTTYGLPLFLEDRTGRITESDYSDIYDRPPFLRLTQTIYPDRIARKVYVFESLNHFQSVRLGMMASPEPLAILEFGLRNQLGTISFERSQNRRFSMERYLRKQSLLGSSLVRSFRASDGIEYTWGFHTTVNQEWTCTNKHTHDLIGHYDLKPPGEPPYSTSGNVLTVYENFRYLAGGNPTELLASLIIMRHIQAHNL
ncbi:hypothetical protein BU17DRAFT_47280 [Hysterangium stoloniferum]|nr:hypothetical protein BU17DRAFT_47280 [Hysterangium stoloniferum]